LVSKKVYDFDGHYFRKVGPVLKAHGGIEVPMVCYNRLFL
jgi:hypothetical protein